MSSSRTGSDAARDDRDRSALLRFVDHYAQLEDFYLAGSAALLWHALDITGGDRRARGLDWMSPTVRLRSPQRRDLLQQVLEREPEARVVTARDGYLHLRVPEGELRFFHYPYDLLEAVDQRGPIASLLDLTTMKLGAVISRSHPRDFADLHRLCQKLDLDRVLDAAQDKFPRVIDFPLQALKGLGDRSPAEEILAESPSGSARDDRDRIGTREWKEICRWLDGPVRGLARRRLGLDPAAASSAHADREIDPRTTL